MPNARQSAFKPSIEDLDNDKKLKEFKAIEKDSLLGSHYRPKFECPRCGAVKNTFYVGGNCLYCGHAL